MKPKKMVNESKSIPSKQQEKQAAIEPGKDVFKLCLFIAVNSIRSQTAVQLLRQVCKSYLVGKCDLEIVDIYQQPELARREQIIATPTLIKYSPKPRKILIGDFSQTERVLSRLGLA